MLTFYEIEADVRGIHVKEVVELQAIMTWKTDAQGSGRSGFQTTEQETQEKTEALRLLAAKMGYLPSEFTDVKMRCML